MKTHEKELHFFKTYNQISCNATTSASEIKLLNEVTKHIDNEVLEIRKLSTNHKVFHFIAQVFPVLLLLALIILLNLNSASFSNNNWINALIFSLIHGVFAYQFVVYTLHEGAGHGLFRNNSVLKWIGFNLSRIFFADPKYYKKRHNDHHRHLGKDNDGAFTHFVLPSRIIKSMLPGAGILYPNDYKIAQPDNPTISTFVSYITGFIFVGIQLFLIGDALPLGISLFCLLILSPWVSMVLDRTRESIEHCNMPADVKFGSWEMGLSPVALLIGGGPWGQPCHFSHHIAPEFSWYQQILLHIKLKEILPQKFAKGFGFGVSVNSRIGNVVKFYYLHLLKTKTKEVVL